MVRPRGTDSARVIQVIETKSMRGTGTNEDLCRIVTQYWDFEGNLLAENDSCITEVKERGEIEMKKIDILGVVYTIEEVEVVNKAEPRRGEINFLTNEIRIDRNMPKCLKNQVLMHEVLHAVFDLLGLSELAEDEEKVQSIATALHQIFSTQTIFSS